MLWVYRVDATHFQQDSLIENGWSTVRVHDDGFDFPFEKVQMDDDDVVEKFILPTKKRKVQMDISKS